MAKSIKSRALGMAHILFKSGLGFTFSRCLSKTYSALKTTTPATELQTWLIDCVKRADECLNLSVAAYWSLCEKINSLWVKLVRI